MEGLAPRCLLEKEGDRHLLAKRGGNERPGITIDEKSSKRKI